MTIILNPSPKPLQADFTPIHASPKSPFVDIDALADLEVTPQAGSKSLLKVGAGMVGRRVLRGVFCCGSRVLVYILL